MLLSRMGKYKIPGETGGGHLTQFEGIREGSAERCPRGNWTIIIARDSQNQLGRSFSLLPGVIPGSVS